MSVAWDSIVHGLEHGEPLPVDPSAHAAELRAAGASFVTLKRAGELRGCVGSLEAEDPLVVDVARNAFRAAFHDSRFARLTPSELAGLDLHVSVLSPLERLDVTSERELLGALRPGIDGIVIREGARRGTFLPAVWDSLPEPADFLRELRQKAGLPEDTWSAAFEVYRYTVRSVAG